MSTILIQNATIFDATDGGTFSGHLLVSGNRIEGVSADAQAFTAADTVIDAQGRFLMPGMTEGHAHLSFDSFTCTADLINPPPEEHAFLTARVAKKLLDMGFTSAYSASEAKLRLAVAVRNEIEAGNLVGPRIRAGSLEISVTGAMGDESRLHNPRSSVFDNGTSPGLIIDGPEEMRKAVRICCREGCDNIKLDASGDPFYPGTPAHTTPMSLEEMEMAVRVAHSYGKMVNVHARSIESIQNCVKTGVDMIYHAEYSDEQTLDMLESVKDRVFVAPSIGLFHNMLHQGEPWLPRPVVEAMGIPALIEESVATHTALRERGIRHLIGGDYGFTWSEQGTQALDLQLFVQYYGYTPAEALICATRNGGLAMRSGQDDLGTLEAGKLADMILVDGNPLEDLSLLMDADKLTMIMKDGVLYKS
jgi:imidazolonepropionase-like amidohydrolase